MRPSLRFKPILSAACILSILASFITGCSRPTPSSWSEQLATAKQAVEKTGSGFIPRDIYISLDENSNPPEFTTIIKFVNKDSSRVDKDATPLYPMRSLGFKDLHLSSTLRIEPDDETVGTREPPDPRLAELIDQIKINPQEVLKLTIADALAFNNGQPITDDVDLEVVTERDFPLMKKDIPKKHVPVAWSIKYSIRDGLYFFVDAQTGEILERYEVHL